MSTMLQVFPKLFRQSGRVAALAAGLLVAAGGWHSAQAQFTVDNLVGKSVGTVPDDMAKPLQQAIELFSKRQFDDARTLLKNTRVKYAQLPPEGVMMAQMFVAANQGLAARGELERCVLNDPKDPEPYLVFGDLAFQNRQITESGLCFDKANELVASYSANPKRKQDLQIRSFAGQAAVASAREQYTLEEQYLAKWIQVEPDSIAAYTRLGRCQYNKGDSEAEKNAYATFRKLYDEVDKETDPSKKVPRAEVNMAVLYTQDDKVDNAKKLMELALQRATPDDVNTRLAVSQWALENGELTLAKQGAAAAAKSDPGSLQALLFSGIAARYEGNTQVAEKAFREALAKSPSNFAALNNLSLTLIEQPDETKRRQALEFAQMNQRINSELKTPAGRESAATLA
ncbi:MAG: hypothetical protein KDA41_16675, partial [Planctomycetales bacterium]|nr:hypothetical protein [Planctomycetales bacterium]